MKKSLLKDLLRCDQQSLLVEESKSFEEIKEPKEKKVRNRKRERPEKEKKLDYSRAIYLYEDGQKDG